MKKNILRILLALVVLATAGGFYVWKYVYNKPHPDYTMMPADFSLGAQQLFDAFTGDQAKAETTYNGKVVEITGIPSRVEQADTLHFVVFVFRQGDFGDEGIRCSLYPEAVSEADQMPTDKPVKIKGYLTGYNGTDVIFEKCSFVE